MVNLPMEDNNSCLKSLMKISDLDQKSLSDIIDTVLKLRRSGLSYTSIKKYLNACGVDVSKATIVR